MDILINEETDHTVLLSEISGLHIDSAGVRTAADHNRLKKSRTLRDFALVYLLEGEGSLRSGAQPPVRVPPRSCFFLFPGVPHLYGPDRGKRWKEIWILFNGILPEGLVEKGLIGPEKAVHGPPNYRKTEIEQELRRIADLAALHPPEYRMEGASILMHLLLMILMPPAAVRDRGGRARAVKIREILSRHIASGEKISSFFHTESMSYNSLRMECRRLLGRSPGEILLGMKMDKAKELLIWTDLPVRLIAEQTGFDDPYHFSRTFRSAAGLSPREFRNEFLSRSEGRQKFADLPVSFYAGE